MIKKYSLALCAIMIALIAGEGVIRLIYPKLGWGLKQDEYLGWANYDYLNIDPSVPGTRGKKRFLFLGDSYLAGAGINSLKDRFSDQFGKEMDSRAEVFTYAAGGWGTDQQYLAFLQKGTVLQPDVVVLAFCALNDLSDIASGKRYGLPKPCFTEENGKLTFFDKAGRASSPEIVKSHSYQTHNPYLQCYLCNFIKWRWRGAGLSYETDKADTISRESRWSLFTAIVHELKKDCNSIGAELHILPVPHTTGMDNVKEQLTTICKAQNIGLINPIPVFNKACEDPDRCAAIWPDSTDQHFSRNGHELIADLLVKYFRGN